MLTKEAISEILHESFRPLHEFFEDPAVTEIMVNPGGFVFVEKAGEMLDMGDLKMNVFDIEKVITSLGKLVKQYPKKNTDSSVISASVGNLRIAGALDPASHGGPSLCIRKHQDPSTRPDLEQLIAKGMISQALADELVRLFVDEHLNVMISGATGSGKTTLATALLKKIPTYERLLSIEDSIELLPGLKHHVPFLANAEQGVTSQLLLKQALRYRPDRLVLGETRGTDTFDLIRAFNSGHDGGLSTVHASSPEQALSALEMLFQMSLPDNASISADVVQRFLAHSVHVVVQVTRRSREVEGKVRTIRKVNDIVRVRGVKNGEYKLERICEVEGTGKVAVA